MQSSQYIGYAASILTTISFVPQVINVVRTKQTRDISLSMYLAFSAGVALWLVYGILINQIPIIGCNSVTLILSLTILYYKLTESRRS